MSETLPVGEWLKHYLYENEWNNTCRRMSETLPVREWVKHYLYENEWNTTCTRMSETLPVREWVKHYLYENEWNTTCTRMSETLPVREWDVRWVSGSVAHDKGVGRVGQVPEPTSHVRTTGQQEDLRVGRRYMHPMHSVTICLQQTNKLIN